MELLAGGMALEELPSKNVPADSLFWFALAHPDYTREQLRLLSKGGREARQARKTVAALTELEPLSFPKFKVAGKLVDIRQVHRLSYAIAEEFDERLAGLGSEERLELARRLDGWQPEASTCPALWR